MSGVADHHGLCAAGDGAEVLLRRRLAGIGELGDRPERGGLRCLAAGVRVDLGVHHQHIDIAPGSQDVIEAAIADVIVIAGLLAAAMSSLSSGINSASLSIVNDFI